MALSAYKDNSAIVTGASSGIGREMALQLADQGAWLTLTARNTQALEQVAAECRKRGARAIVVTADVSDEAQCKKIIEAAVAEYGRIDTLINNAGFGQGGYFESLPNLETFRQVMDVNFMGTVYCAHHALPHLKKACGRIVSISSIMGLVGVPMYSSYSASKFAMTGFAEVIRMELMGSGVSVTSIHPNFVVSEFAGRLLKPDGTPLGDKGKRIYTSRTMTSSVCARLTLQAAAKRKRHVVMTPSGKLVVFMHGLVPGLVDKVMRKMFGKK
ncbi:MAG TPA: SDR family oxidoreductase [Candidatus Brocadiia bacterium]|nr:SDR family oxidoreductase [Candidatus Brocadiia bacterium]